MYKIITIYLSIWQKFEDIDSVAVGVVDKALEDVVQPILEQAYSPPLVLQDRYRFDVLMNKDSNEVAPDIGNHDDGKEIGHTGLVTDMWAFDIEAARFHALEHRLHLPSEFVHLQSFLCITVRDKDLQLGLALLVLDFRARQVTSLPVNVVDTIKMLTLTKFQVVEQPECPGFLAVSVDTEVLAYPDVVVNASCVQVSHPFASDELPVSHQMLDGVLAGKTDEPIDKVYPLLRIGVAPLVHHLEYDGERHAIVDDAQSEDVYVGIAELPVCPVKRKVIQALDRYQL